MDGVGVAFIDEEVGFVVRIPHVDVSARRFILESNVPGGVLADVVAPVVVLKGAPWEPRQ